jgi:DNA-binding beta-propeller fold protein YncE
MLLRAVAVAFAVLASLAGDDVAPAAKPPPRVRLQEPFDVLALNARRALVADRRANAVLLLDLRRRTGRRFVRMREPRAFARLPGGRIAVASGRDVLALHPRTGRTQRLLRAAAVVLGVAVTADGTIYASEGGTTIIRRGQGGLREVVAQGFDGVHGMLATGSGILLAEAFGGRVLLLQLDRSTRELARGLGNPSYIARARDGTIYLTEFSGSRVSRLMADGTAQRVAAVSSPGGIAAAPGGSLLVVTLDGRVVSVAPASGATRTVYP